MYSLRTQSNPTTPLRSCCACCDVDPEWRGVAQVSPAERIVSLFRVFQRARAHFTTRTRTVPLFFSFYTSVFLALSSFRAVAQHKLRLASCRLMFSHRGVKFSTTAGDANIQAEGNSKGVRYICTFLDAMERISGFSFRFKCCTASNSTVLKLHPIQKMALVYFIFYVLFLCIIRNNFFFAPVWIEGNLS